MPYIYVVPVMLIFLLIIVVGISSIHHTNQYIYTDLVMLYDLIFSVYIAVYFQKFLNLSTESVPYFQNQI